MKKEEEEEEKEQKLTRRVGKDTCKKRKKRKRTCVGDYECQGGHTQEEEEEVFGHESLGGRPHKAPEMPHDSPHLLTRDPSIPETKEAQTKKYRYQTGLFFITFYQ
ncbi:hypothetical protein E2C01_054083 [Portunus trituberculatus]|uniref:Uncharacterized protein n=1 Tax=Portunus trituberculatus TaxID=210409 RepID=A0A5B7GSS2_PORTR|nr:hypothetical protein [Portunus trituberculatus]